MSWWEVLVFKLTLPALFGFSFGYGCLQIVNLIQRKRREKRMAETFEVGDEVRYKEGVAHAGSEGIIIAIATVILITEDGASETQKAFVFSQVCPCGLTGVGFEELEKVAS